MTAPTCERHGAPLTRVDDMPDGGRHWRCLADGVRCLSSYWEPTAAWPDHPASADTAVEQLEGPAAGWRPARNGETPGQCEPEHGPVQPIDLEPHHAAARRRTHDEHVALRPKYATGGVVRSGPAIVGDGPKGAIL